MACDTFEEQDFGFCYTHLKTHIDRVSRRRPVEAETLIACPVVQYLIAHGALPGPGPVRGAVSRAELARVAGELAKNNPSVPTLGRLAKALDRSHDDGGHAYFTVPVTALPDAGSSSKAGALYLQLQKVPLQEGEGGVGALSTDSKLPRYASIVANAVVKSVYLTTVYNGAEKEIPGFEFSCAFGHKIDEGKSFGAALACAFFLAYLDAKLYETKCVAPKYGTAITGEVTADGAVAGVADIVAKLSGLIGEYGEDIQIVAPEANRGDILNSPIPRGRIRFVRTVDELLSAVFDSEHDGRGMALARSLLARTLSAQDKRSLKPFVRPGVDPAHYEDGAAPTETLVEHEGLWLQFRAWEDVLEVELATKRESLAARAQGTNDVFLVLDGGPAAGALWTPAPGTGICPMTELLFEVRGIDPAPGRRVWCAFLGSREIIPVGAIPRDFDAKLRALREREGLVRRGPYVRPAREALAEHSNAPGSRIYVVSDQEISDLQDIVDLPIELLPIKRLRSGTAWDTHAIREQFRLQSATLEDVEFRFPDRVPVEWPKGKFTFDASSNAWVVKMEEHGALLQARFRFFKRHPGRFEVRGKVNGRRFERDQTVLITHQGLARKPDWISGDLTDEEAVAWVEGAPIASGSRSRIRPETSFPSIRSAIGDHHGWLVMHRDLNRWILFSKGCVWANGRERASAFVAADEGLYACFAGNAPHLLRANRSDIDIFEYAGHSLSFV